MSRVPTFAIFLLIAMIAVIIIPAVHKYESHKVAAASKPKDYSALYATAQKQMIALTTSNGTLQAQVTELTSMKSQLCSDLAKNKLTDVICQ